jgi:hypothetical protein
MTSSSPYKCINRWTTTFFMNNNDFQLFWTWFHLWCVHLAVQPGSHLNPVSATSPLDATWWWRAPPQPDATLLEGPAGARAFALHWPIHIWNKIVCYNCTFALQRPIHIWNKIVCYKKKLGGLGTRIRNLWERWLMSYH